MISLIYMLQDKCWDYNDKIRVVKDFKWKEQKNVNKWSDEKNDMASENML